MTLLFGLFGSREHSDFPRSKSANSRRRLRFESLEDRQLLAAGEHISGDYYVDPGETETIFGVEYSIPTTETGSLKLTPVLQYNATTKALIEETIIISNDNVEKPVLNISVSGKYTGKVDGVDGTGTTYFGRVYDDTTANVTIEGELPYYVKRDQGTITVIDGGNVTSGLVGKSGKNVDVIIEDGGIVYLSSVYTTSQSSNNYLRNITVKAGGSVPYATGIGNNNTTTVQVDGGSLLWQNNPQYGGRVKSFSMSSGSMELRNGLYTIGEITGGTILCNLDNTSGNAYTFQNNITNATVTLQKFNSATFAENVSNLVVGDGQNPITIAAGKTVDNLTLNGTGSVTLNGNATIMTVNSGNALINSTATIGTLNLNGGTVIFSAGFTENTTYKIAPHQSLIDGSSNTMYFNNTDGVIETSDPTDPASGLTPSAPGSLHAFDNKSGYYLLSGTANVDETNWVFKDGTSDKTGTVYAFYGTNTLTLTLEAGATASYSGVDITPYSPEGGTPDNVTFVLENTGTKITSNVAEVSGKGSVRLDKGITAYASVSGDDELKVYLYCETAAKENEQSKIIYDGLIASREYSKSQSYVGFIGISPGVLEIGEQMAATKIRPVAGAESTSTVINKPSPGYLYANVPMVDVQEFSILIYSEVETLTVSGEKASAEVTDNGKVKNASISAGKTSVGASGNGRIDSITIDSDSDPRNIGNVRLRDSSSVGAVTMPSGTYLRFQQGVSVGDTQGDLILEPSAILQRFTSLGYGTNDIIAYTVLANAQMSGKVNTDGSSVFTLANQGDIITVNGLNYIAKENNTVVNISVDGAVTGNLTIESGVRITTLLDIVSDEDQFISLREAITYAQDNITWEVKPNSFFAPTYYGYDFSTGSLVQGKDMVEGGSYYIPVRTDRDIYDGTRESVNAAIVHFDSSLATQSGVPTILLDYDLGELVINKTIAIDGKIGDNQSVVIDRGLVEYHEENFDLVKISKEIKDLNNTPPIVPETINATWKDIRTDNTIFGRIININTPDISVALANMTLSGAYFNAYGGVIFSRADLSLLNIDIVGNYSKGYPSDSISSTIYNSGGTINMMGGSLEGNRLDGWGNVFSKITDSTDKTISFDGVIVRHNVGDNGVFIEPFSQQNIIITDCVVDENVGVIIHSEQPFNLTLKDSSFTNNFTNGSMYLCSGITTVENCIFDNSGYDFTGIDYVLSTIRPYATTAKTEVVFTNCLFNEMGFRIGKYSGGETVDITLDHCTVTNCVNPMPPILTSNGLEIANANYSLNLTLNDSIIIGNDIDLDNLQETAGKQVNIVVNNSIIGYYIDDAGTATLTPTASIVEQYEAGSVTFVQTTDPAADGYYEAETVTVNGSTFNVRGTSAENKEVSILGYNYGVATDLTMKQIANSFYTTVTTLEDTVDPTDGVVSLREAIAYATANIVDPVTITFDENLADAADVPTIQLLSDLVITTANISIDGTLKNGKVVTIAKDATVTDEVRLVNQGTLSLSNINLPVGLIGATAEGSTTVSGNVSLGYFAEPDADTPGCLSVEQTSVLTISTFDDSGNESVYLIHHDTLVPPETTGDPLFLFATDGTIASYKIGTTGTVSTDLLQLAKAVSIPLYTENTTGIKVADILFFGNARLPVGTNGATFTVTQAGTTPVTVTDSFEWIYKGTSNTEVCGLKVNAGTSLAAGTYTVSVTYSDLVQTFNFDVLASVSVSLVTSTGTATPQNKKLTDVILTAGTANNFYSNPSYTLSWVSNETPLNVDTYFKVVTDTTNPKAFNLVYKGGLTARENAYSVRVTAQGTYKSASADFELSVVTPTITLTPDQGEITVVTKKSELATVALSKFDPAAPINWTFELEGTEDTTHFSVDANNKLIYTRSGYLPPSTDGYSLKVIADNGRDSASYEYTLTVKDCKLEVDTIFASITTNNHDLNIARIIPVNFPVGTTEYSLSWDVSGKNIYDYFAVVTDNQGKTYLHYSSGLAVGTYDISVIAKCTAENPDDGNVTTQVWTSLAVTTPGVTASVVLDPTNRQMETKDAVDGFQLASVELRDFEDVPVITVQAWNTTAKGENGEEVVKKNYSDCFTVVDGKLNVVQDSLFQVLVSGEYAVTVTATTYSIGNSIIQQAAADFILTLYDKKVETEYTHITIDFNPTEEKFEVKKTEDPDNIIDEGQANVLIIEMKDTNTTPVITITEEAMKNLDAIHIESEVENIIVIEDAGEPEPGVPVANHFIIDSATDMYQDRPTAVTITANETTQSDETQIAKTTSSGTKNITITSTEGMPTQYDINTLSTNVQINTNPNTDPDKSDTISFAGGNSQAGIVLNLDKTEYGQSVYTGQPGTLTLNGTPGEVVLSPGNDIVTGSASGSVITDTSDSWNTITLNGTSPEAENVVTLNAGATIIVNGEANNKIIVENADNTVLNLAKATGDCETTIKGNNTTITGGTGKNTLNLTGDYAIVNSPNCEEDMIVNITGNGAIVKTGRGNDVIHIEGNDSLVSTGAGNDTIYLEGSSSGNSISTGDGNDIVISTSTGGNTFYADGGNDFIIGGAGRDRIFGGTGYSILAGGGGADRIIGGSARDIILANLSSNLVGMDPAELLIIRNKLFETEPWWEDGNLENAIAELGTSSEPDGAADSLSRESDSGIDVFFRNLSDPDTLSNVLESDLIYD